MARGGVIERAERIAEETRFLISRARQQNGAVYDAIAPLYDEFRALWMRIAGQGAEDAMMQDLAAVVGPGARVLDAGCGTGAVTAQILEVQPDCRITMLDLSAAMLAQAQRYEGNLVLGDVRRLPFGDNTFDVVACAWTIETVDDPFGAVTEMLRVLSEDGQLIYTFSAVPGGWLSRASTALLRSVLRRRFGGRLRPAESSPWHDCERSHRSLYQGGLAVEVALRKCCSVEDAVIPATMTGET